MNRPTKGIPPAVLMGLTWYPFPASRPPKTTCFFSDGCAIYWCGWYTSDDGIGIIVRRGDGTQECMTPEQFSRVQWWAHPGNFVSQAIKLEEGPKDEPIPPTVDPWEWAW